MKDKTKKAIGLKYNTDNNNSPTVIAKGFGGLADEIIELAKQNGVMIHEDPYLSDLLARLTKVTKVNLWYAYCPAFRPNILHVTAINNTQISPASKKVTTVIKSKKNGWTSQPLKTTARGQR